MYQQILGGKRCTQTRFPHLARKNVLLFELSLNRRATCEHRVFLGKNTERFSGDGSFLLNESRAEFGVCGFVSPMCAAAPLKSFNFSDPNVDF